MRSGIRMGIFLSSWALLALLLYPKTGCEEFEVKSIAPAVKLTWDGNFGDAYQLWRSDSPQGPWEKVGQLLAGFDAEMSTYAGAPQGRVWFYRIEALPGAPPGMVAIPGGTFEMGDHFGDGWQNELPLHTVRVDSFFMDATEVTNDQFCAFLNSLRERGVVHYDSDENTVSGSGASSSSVRYASLGSDILHDSVNYAFHVSPGRANHPATAITWRGAIAYCNWRSKQEGLPPCYDTGSLELHLTAGGYRLPTEAEWEFAARGGLRYARYPWGNDIDGTNANFADSGDPYEGEDPGTTPVACYPANSYGLFDMAGNAAEWCNDFYSQDYYQYCVDNSLVDNPTGPLSLYPSAFKYIGDGERVVRGGSWRSSAVYPERSSLRCCSRDHQRPGTGGFRYVRRPTQR